MLARGILLVICSTCLTGCIAVNQGSRPMGSIVQQTKTPPQPGDWCRVTYPEYRRGLLARGQSIVTGKVETVDKDGIHLSEVTGRSMVSTPLLENLPVIRRYFKNTGVGTEHDRVVKLDGSEQVEIISEQEGRQGGLRMIPRDQNIAQHLVAAVPGRR